MRSSEFLLKKKRRNNFNFFFASEKYFEQKKKILFRSAFCFFLFVLILVLIFRLYLRFNVFSLILSYFARNNTLSRIGQSDWRLWCRKKSKYYKTKIEFLDFKRQHTKNVRFSFDSPNFAYCVLNRVNRIEITFVKRNWIRQIEFFILFRLLFVASFSVFFSSSDFYFIRLFVLPFFSHTYEMTILFDSH